MVIASVFPVTISPHATSRLGTDAPTSRFQGKQGEVLFIEVPVADHAGEVTGQFLGRRVLFFPLRSQTYAGLLGIDMEDAPGQHELHVTIRHPGGRRKLIYPITVLPEAYPTQRMTLPKNKVELDAATLKRVRTEQQTLLSVFESVTPHPLWEGPCVEPVEGRVTGVFGSRRIINGYPRNPHSGEDIAAPTGTPVRAMNAGVVRMTIDHFFTGKGVIIDHGMGLFSMYFHLREIAVEQGQRVHRGQVIGTVGSTGRATGPHLHWGVRLNGARVDPYALMRLPLGR
ncbi:MAG: M23 family metallopeptidase [Nitrospirae bacterium]|nr:MAG: M23 family metallopeptidase [Nitrospirota bacterium]